MTMGQFISPEKNAESFLLICTYCDKHRSDTGYRDPIFESYGRIPETCLSHGICPECLQLQFLNEASYCEEGNVVIKEPLAK
jgi:hypothetical protein